MARRPQGVSPQRVSPKEVVSPQALSAQAGRRGGPWLEMASHEASVRLKGASLGVASRHTVVVPAHSGTAGQGVAL